MWGVGGFLGDEVCGCLFVGFSWEGWVGVIGIGYLIIE